MFKHGYEWAAAAVSLLAQHSALAANDAAENSKPKGAPIAVVAVPATVTFAAKTSSGCHYLASTFPEDCHGKQNGFEISRSGASGFISLGITQFEESASQSVFDKGVTATYKGTPIASLHAGADLGMSLKGTKATLRGGYHLGDHVTVSGMAYFGKAQATANLDAALDGHIYPLNIHKILWQYHDQRKAADKIGGVGEAIAYDINPHSSTVVSLNQASRIAVEGAGRSVGMVVTQRLHEDGMAYRSRPDTCMGEGPDAGSQSARHLINVVSLAVCSNTITRDYLHNAKERRLDAYTDRANGYVQQTFADAVGKYTSYRPPALTKDQLFEDAPYSRSSSFVQVAAMGSLGDAANYSVFYRHPVRMGVGTPKQARFGLTLTKSF